MMNRTYKLKASFRINNLKYARHLHHDFILIKNPENTANAISVTKDAEHSAIINKRSLK